MSGSAVAAIIGSIISAGTTAGVAGAQAQNVKMAEGETKYLQRLMDRQNKRRMDRAALREQAAIEVKNRGLLEQGAELSYARRQRAVQEGEKKAAKTEMNIAQLLNTPQMRGNAVNMFLRMRGQ